MASLSKLNNPPFSILVVEDDASIQLMYKIKLEHEGYLVSVAHDGIEGFQMAKDYNPSLILLDLRMPRMNGDEMLIKLRAMAWGASIRIIILTNISRNEAPKSLLLLNVDRYVVKAHHTPKQVVDIVCEVLDGGARVLV